MNTSHLVYSHCSLQCPNLHRIPVPCPNLLEIEGSLQQTTKGNRKAVFVCPDCGLGSAYSAQDIVQDMIAGTPSLFLAGECHLVSLEIECDGQNCEAPKLAIFATTNTNGICRTSGLRVRTDERSSTNRLQTELMLSLDPSVLVR
jgi:hypothetical protein